MGTSALAEGIPLTKGSFGMLRSESRRTADHPSAVMSGGEARSRNRHGRFSLVFSKTCHSTNGPVPVNRHGACLSAFGIKLGPVIGEICVESLR